MLGERAVYDAIRELMSREEVLGMLQGEKERDVKTIRGAWDSELTHERKATVLKVEFPDNEDVMLTDGKRCIKRSGQVSERGKSEN